MSTPPSMPSGWFPDPHGRHEHRWFNGTAWTADVADGGQRFIDPFGAAPGGPPVYGGGYGVPPKRGNGPAAASITCGLIALVTAWLPFVVGLGIVLAIAAIWTGIVGLRRSQVVDQSGQRVGRNLAITGLVTGGAAVLLSVLGVIFTVSVWREVVAFIEPGPHDTEVVSCELESGALVIRATITNEDDETHDYTVFGVVSEPDRVSDLTADVADVPPGDTREFELRRSTVATGPCDVRLVVHGPMPYGIDIERVNE